MYVRYVVFTLLFNKENYGHRLVSQSRENHHINKFGRSQFTMFKLLENTFIEEIQKCNISKLWRSQPNTRTHSVIASHCRELSI